MRRLSLLLCLAILVAACPVVAQDLPMTGTAAASMASFDRLVVQLMVKRQIPGGAVAVSRDGRLVFARGYGRADVDANQLVQPNSRFRIASISKSLTATAILKLVEEGRLQLDAKAFTILDQLRPPAGATVDRRVADITVRHLLHHGGGWDASATFEPTFMPYLRQAAQAVGAPEPATCETVIRFMLGRPLDFPPGARYAYSTLGYCVLGRIIEKVTGQRYEEYVRSSVLSPVGITRMQIGRTKLEERAAGEVRYYAASGDPQTGQSVFPGAGTAPVPYGGGGFTVEGIDSGGGWIASPIDLLRFINALEGRKGAIFRNPNTFRMMLARPTPPLGSSPPTPLVARVTQQRVQGLYYAMGWFVLPEGNGVTWWHTGSVPGMQAHLLRAAEGWAWAVLFNSERRDYKAFANEVDSILSQAARQVTGWPGHDLFSQYP